MPRLPGLPQLQTDFPRVCHRRDCIDLTTGRLMRDGHSHPVEHLSRSAEVSPTTANLPPIVMPPVFESHRPRSYHNDLSRYRMSRDNIEPPANATEISRANEERHASFGYSLSGSADLRSDRNYEARPWLSEPGHSSLSHSSSDSDRRLPSFDESFGALARSVPSGDSFSTTQSYAARLAPLPNLSRLPDDGGPESPISFGSRSPTAEGQAPKSYYDFTCAADPLKCKGEQNIRKCVSHFFGRNKSCTKNISEDFWLSSCRKHYQRVKYNASKTRSWALVQHEQLITQMTKFHAHFECNNWEIKFQSGLEKAMSIYATTNNIFSPGIEEAYRPQLLSACFVKDFLGKGLNNEDVWRFIYLMKQLIEKRELEENLCVEFLPHNLELRPEVLHDALLSNKTLAKSVRLDQAREDFLTGRLPSRPRTNRAALARTGRHATHHGTPRDAATPRQAPPFRLQISIPRNIAAERVLPPLTASRVGADSHHRPSSRVGTRA